MNLTNDDLRIIKQVVRSVCRYCPSDQPEVLSRTVERMWRWYNPEQSPEVYMTQAARRMATLALADVRSEAPPEIPIDFSDREWDDLTPLWQVAETVTPEEEISRSDEWVDLIGSVVAGVGIRAASIVELMFRGGRRQKEIANLLDISPPAVNKHWTRARSYLRSVLPEPPAAREKKYLASGAWGTVRGVIYHPKS